MCLLTAIAALPAAPPSPIPSRKPASGDRAPLQPPSNSGTGPAWHARVTATHPRETLLLATFLFYTPPQTGDLVRLATPVSPRPTATQLSILRRSEGIEQAQV